MIGLLRTTPGDVPEKHDRRVRLSLANQPRQERKMVILDQDDGVVLACLPGYDGRKLLVDRAISIPSLSRKAGRT